MINMHKKQKADERRLIDVLVSVNLRFADKFHDFELWPILKGSNMVNYGGNTWYHKRRISNHEVVEQKSVCSKIF